MSSWFLARFTGHIDSPIDHQTRSVLYLVLVSILIMFIFYLIAGIGPKRRRLIYLQPGMVIALAIAAQALLNRVMLIKTWGTPISFLIIGMLALNTLTNSVVEHVRWPVDFPRY